MSLTRFSEQFSSSPHLSWSRNRHSQTVQPLTREAHAVMFNANKLFFPTSLNPKGTYFSFVSVYLLLLYWRLLFPAAFLLKESIWHRQWEPLTLAHIRRFYTSQALSENNQNCRGQAEESTIMLNTASLPKLKSLCLTRLNKPLCSVLFALEVSSIVLPLSPNKSLIVGHMLLWSAKLTMWLIREMLSVSAACVLNDVQQADVLWIALRITLYH